MGIKGLHKFVESVAQPVHISEYRGKCLAVDAMIWLHRGSVGQLLRLVYLLRTQGVDVLVVFDGAPLPMKGRTDAKRRELREGDETASVVTPQMSRSAIAKLRELGVPFVVAPYEADPQLAHLVETGTCAAARPAPAPRRRLADRHTAADSRRSVHVGRA